MVISSERRTSTARWKIVLFLLIWFSIYAAALVLAIGG
jgi:hypothetical protein